MIALRLSVVVDKTLVRAHSGTFATTDHEPEKRPGRVKITKLNAGHLSETEDFLAAEEPLEIRINGKAISVTMRTPGLDKELAAGFLFTEGILRTPAAIKDINESGNLVNVILHDGYEVSLHSSERNFYTTSSCGVCGKSSIDAIKTHSSFNSSPDNISIKAAILMQLHEKLRDQQSIFDRTGGLHASALFDPAGNLLQLKEDVGRHNALDKLIGSSFLEGALPLSSHILLLSGRASFELVQKSAMAGIRIIAAVGAPSSLAVETAKEFNITLAGFLRAERFNLYSASHRIQTKHENQD